MVARGWIKRAVAVGALLACSAAADPAAAAHLSYGWQKADGVDLFYREGGPAAAPTIVFLHGNPSSSIQYQEVMERLASSGYHVIAVDYPSFGYSAAPSTKAYTYTFDHVAQTVEAFLQARGITRYALYMQDYGVPVGFRVIEAHPDRVSAVIVQNGAIHLDGFPSAQDPKGELRQHWLHRNPTIDARRKAYAAGLGYPAPANWEEDGQMSPDAILLMAQSEQRPGVIDARNDLWFDYGSNIARYPRWQKMLHDLHPPTLVIWGSKDDFFTVPGAVAYLRDVPDAEVHVLDTVHFATLEQPDEVGALIEKFMAKRADRPASIKP